MEGRREIFQEDFDSLLAEAIEDLQKSGLDHKEVFSVVREHFGLKYAKKFCTESSYGAGSQDF
jgi:hypothetical protein